MYSYMPNEHEKTLQFVRLRISFYETFIIIFQKIFAS